MQMSLCSAETYKGCMFEGYINLPFTDWSISDGTYVNYTIVGQDDCSQILCQNNPVGHDPFSCIFKLGTLNSQKLYLRTLSGRSPGFQATFSMRITCTTPAVSIKPIVSHSGLSTCPSKYEHSQRIVRIIETNSVKTSPKTSDSQKYSLIVCPDTTTFAKLEFVAQARDDISAMATFFCSTPDCNTNNSPIGWFDDSGTAINNIQIDNLKTQQMWFNVYGWGAFQSNNTYTFSINMKNG